MGRRLGLSLGSERGFTLTEVLIVIVVSSGIVATVAVAYNATLRSWEGTAALADAQREGALAVEVMANGIRPGSVVTIGSQSDSIAVVLQRDAGDTVIASYYLDTLGNIHSASGAIIASGVDSLGFSTTDTKEVNIDVVLRDDLQTPDWEPDDQGVLYSSTVICRN